MIELLPPSFSCLLLPQPQHSWVPTFTHPTHPTLKEQNVHEVLSASLSHAGQDME